MATANVCSNLLCLCARDTTGWWALRTWATGHSQDQHGRKCEVNVSGLRSSWQNDLCVSLASLIRANRPSLHPTGWTDNPTQRQVARWRGHRLCWSIGFSLSHTASELPLSQHLEVDVRRAQESVKKQFGDVIMEGNWCVWRVCSWGRNRNVTRKGLNQTLDYCSWSKLIHRCRSDTHIVHEYFSRTQH